MRKGGNGDGGGCGDDIGDGSSKVVVLMAVVSGEEGGSTMEAMGST